MNLREAWISASSFVESYQYMIVKVHFVVLKNFVRHQQTVCALTLQAGNRQLALQHCQHLELLLDAQQQGPMGLPLPRAWLLSLVATSAALLCQGFVAAMYAAIAR